MTILFNKSIIQNNDCLVVAVSGGMDSMVLLHILNKMKSDKNLSLHVCHVNHQVRLASELEEMFVQKTCNRYGISFLSYQFNKSSTSNFHEDARNQRYQFFYDCAKQVGATKIVLAHQADDQAETILMRLIRGSSFVGYKGISEQIAYKDLTIIRPILKTSRDNIVAYQKEHNVEFMEDESNDENHYTRETVLDIISYHLSKKKTQKR